MASLAYWAFASLHPALRALGSAPLASKLALGFKSFLQHKKETANAISFSWRRRRDSKSVIGIALLAFHAAQCGLTRFPGV